MEEVSTIRLLIEHGANFKMQVTYGRSPLYLAFQFFLWCWRRHKTTDLVIELLELMVNKKAVLSQR